MVPLGIKKTEVNARPLAFSAKSTVAIMERLELFLNWEERYMVVLFKMLLLFLGITVLTILFRSGKLILRTINYWFDSIERRISGNTEDEGA